jgi:hypothetical protein
MHPVRAPVRFWRRDAGPRGLSLREARGARWPLWESTKSARAPRSRHRPRDTRPLPFRRFRRSCGHRSGIFPVDSPGNAPSPLPPRRFPWQRATHRWPLRRAREKAARQRPRQPPWVAPPRPTTQPCGATDEVLRLPRMLVRRFGRAGGRTTGYPQAARGDRHRRGAQPPQAITWGVGGLVEKNRRSFGAPVSPGIPLAKTWFSAETAARAGWRRSLNQAEGSLRKLVDGASKEPGRARLGARMSLPSTRASWRETALDSLATSQRRDH